MRKLRAPLAAYDKDLNYEDPILLNEINRKMGLRIEDLKNKNIKVNHEYDKGYELLKPPLANKHAAGKWQAYNPDKFDGEIDEDFGTQKFVNVPRTPTLANYLTLAEEAAHAEDTASSYIYPDESEKGMLMNRWLEETRAKEAAKKEVGGYLTPQANYLHEAYLNSYLQGAVKPSLKYSNESFKENKPESDFERELSLLLGGNPGPLALPRDYWNQQKPNDWIKENHPDLAKRLAKDRQINQGIRT